MIGTADIIPVGEIDTGDTAWMLVSTALVMLMVPGLALFYGGMVRRKNILATMMHSMAAFAVVGVFWFVCGYALAFGEPLISFGEAGSVLGWSGDLFCLRGVADGSVLPNSGIPVYVHAMFQGMFAILTPALIAGAMAERIRFGPYCLFILLWVTLVYCPLAHAVWCLDFWAGGEDAGKTAVGWIGKTGALDFAGGTVVHIAAGLAGLAGALCLRRRVGYPDHPHAPSGLALTLVGAALLWFGWFGFNAGSAIGSSATAGLAFAVTQAGAVAGGLGWMLVEWVHRGKPTALGLASGFIAGLVAVTPAAGFVAPSSGLIIGLASGGVCYAAVVGAKNALGYDDSLDAFGIHGVGGFLGAVLTGVFALEGSGAGLIWIQTKAAVIAAVFAFSVSFALIKLIDVTFGFTVPDAVEFEGLDQSEHGEVGFDFGYTSEGATGLTGIAEPRVAVAPPDGKSRFTVTVRGVGEQELARVWSELCLPSDAGPSPNFKAVYPSVTTFRGNTFYFRRGDPASMSESLKALFQDKVPGANVSVQVQTLK